MTMDRRTIDLNADLGEGFPHDAAILERVTSASVACGAHAGDRETIVRTLREARRRGVAVGAHPGYADRDGFGRREQSLSAEQVRDLIVGQVTSLAVTAAEEGSSLAFVKPHGALYNQAQWQEEVADGVVAALAQLRLPLLGQPGSLLEARSRAASVRYIPEGFPDRRYRDDGRLVPRGEPGAVLHDPGEMDAQVVRLVDRGVLTLCIHGDDPRALANVEAVRATLLRLGIATACFA
jgi:UPF0271 protein